MYYSSLCHPPGLGYVSFRFRRLFACYFRKEDSKSDFGEVVKKKIHFHTYYIHVNTFKYSRIFKISSSFHTMLYINVHIERNNRSFHYFADLLPNPIHVPTVLHMPTENTHL